MPRDANGNYTLPTGNPVTPGTIIETNWANPTMADVAAALTESLSRSGQGGMLVPFRVADGTMLAPGLGFVNEPTSGLYRKSANALWFTVGNEDILGITKDGITIATGKTTNIAVLTRIQDAEPTANVGDQWFESDTGGLYIRYRNPDNSLTWVQVNLIGGDWVPLHAGLNTLLGDYASDSAAGAAGVLLGGMYRTGNAVKVRIS